MLKTPSRHAELVSASYFPRRNSKMLERQSPQVKRVQDDEAWESNTGKGETAPKFLARKRAGWAPLPLRERVAQTYERAR